MHSANSEHRLFCGVHISKPYETTAAALSLSQAISIGDRFPTLFRDFPNVQGPLLCSQANGDDSGAYQIITGSMSPVSINNTFKERFPIPDGAPQFKALDLRTQVPRFRVSGNFATFTGFTELDDTSQYSHIDFIFGGSSGGWWEARISSHATIN